MEEKSFSERIKNAWNAFVNNRDPTQYNYREVSYNVRPDKKRLTRGNEKTIVTSIYNKIAVDVSMLDFKHIKKDKNGTHFSIIDSYLNSCLTLEANLDETASAFKRDLVLSLLDEGCIAIVPVDTSANPSDYGSFEIYSIRVGKVIEWFPSKVKINLYNDRTGKKQDVVLNKSSVCIIENPFYSIMNEYNSTMQRLKRKLALLDDVDEQISSGKIDLIIQLPYTIKTEAKRREAENRRKDIEFQLTDSKYGIAYADAAEKITQLNRPVENNLLSQVKYLTELGYSQLGITEAILNGTASEQEQTNYFENIIAPIADVIVGEMRRKWLTKTARTQGHDIQYFRDPFKIIPATKWAEMADKLSRNEIMSSNEIRQKMGLIPSDDPSADELRNKNLNQSVEKENQTNKEENANENGEV